MAPLCTVSPASLVVMLTGWPPAMLPGPSKGSQAYAPKSRGNNNWPK